MAAALLPDPQPHYTYHPLHESEDSVRLVTLYAGERDNPIRGSLACHRLSKVPKFSALSYEWGPFEPHQGIEVDGRVFLVRANIYAFLTELRGSQADCTLWADAICIDHENIKERDKQVSLMAQIYESAEEVHSWLGPSADRSTEVMEILRGMNSLVSSVGGEGEVKAPELPANDLFLRLCKYLLVQPFWKLMNRSYWSRLWVLQEIILAKRVVLHCGTSSCDLTKTFWRVVRGASTWTADGQYALGSAEICLLREPNPDFELQESPQDFGMVMERPFPVYGSQDPQLLNFTFRRPAGDQDWQVEFLKLNYGFNTTSTRCDQNLGTYHTQQPEIAQYWSAGPCSFEKGGSLSLCIDMNNADAIAQEFAYFVRYTSTASLAQHMLAQWDTEDVRWRTRTEPFSAIMSRTRWLSCKDFHDRVYALLGVVAALESTESGQPVLLDLRPDYTCNAAELMMSTLKASTMGSQSHLGITLIELLDLAPGRENAMHLDDLMEKQVALSRQQRLKSRITIPLHLEDQILFADVKRITIPAELDELLLLADRKRLASTLYEYKPNYVSGSRQPGLDFLFHCSDGKRDHDGVLFEWHQGSQRIGFLAERSRDHGHNYCCVGVGFKSYLGDPNLPLPTPKLMIRYMSEITMEHTTIDKQNSSEKEVAVAHVPLPFFVAVCLPTYPRPSETSLGPAHS